MKFRHWKIITFSPLGIAKDLSLAAALIAAGFSFNVRPEPPKIPEPPQQQQKETAVQQAAENF